MIHGLFLRSWSIHAERFAPREELLLDEVEASVESGEHTGAGRRTAQWQREHETARHAQRGGSHAVCAQLYAGVSAAPKNKRRCAGDVADGRLLRLPLSHIQVLLSRGHRCRHRLEHAALERVEAHHRRAMSSHGPHEVPQWKDAHAQLGIVSFLVLLTLLFEFGQEIIEEKYAKYRSVLAHVWGELTVLGFLALITFMMVQSEVLQAVSELVFGDEMHMVHMFEKIHFALFFVLVFFLALALWLLVCIAKREAIIDQYETRIIAYGRLRAGQGLSLIHI